MAILLPPVVGVCFVIYRLTSRILNDGFSRRRPIVILSLLGVSHLLRIIFAIDPFGMRGLYDPFNALFWLTPNVAVSLVCDFLVLFYWNYALRSFGGRDIGRFEKYFYFLFAFIFAAEFTSTTLRSFAIAFAMQVIVQVFYVILEVIIIGFVAFTVFNLYQFIQKQGESPSVDVMRVTRLILVVAVLLAALALMSCMVLAPWFRTAKMEFVYWPIAFGFVSLASIVETLILSPSSQRRRITIDVGSNSTAEQMSSSVVATSYSTRPGGLESIVSSEKTSIDSETFHPHGSRHHKQSQFTTEEMSTRKDVRSVAES